jgi:hypothetical protein
MVLFSLPFFMEQQLTVAIVECIESMKNDVKGKIGIARHVGAMTQEAREPAMRNHRAGDGWNAALRARLHEHDDRRIRRTEPLIQCQGA